MPVALRLIRRIDGSLCLSDPHGLLTGDNREFPDPHFFAYLYLATTPEAAVAPDGGQVTLNLANAKAVYRVTGRRPDGVDVELVDFELRDPPALDEKLAAANREAKQDRAAQAEAADTSTAFPGDVVVRDDAGNEVPLTPVEGS